MTTEPLNSFIRLHGARVRRAQAMALLNVRSPETFRKIVDANPGLRHRLDGEGQTWYVTAVIFTMLPNDARRAAGSGDQQPSNSTLSTHS